MYLFDLVFRVFGDVTGGTSSTSVINDAELTVPWLAFKSLSSVSDGDLEVVIVSPS